MKQRLVTGSILVVGLVLLILSRLLTPVIFDFGIGAFAVLGAVEVARVFERSGKHSNIIMASIYPAVLYLGVCLAIAKGWSWIGYVAWFVVSLAIYFGLIILVSYILINKTKEEIATKKLEISLHKYALFKAINTIIVCVYPTVLFFALILINHMASFKIVAENELLLNSNFDFMLIIMIFAVQILTDSLAMLVGSKFKGPKLCPVVSPKKTISGAIGGMLGGVVGALVIYGFFMLNGPFKAMYTTLELNVWYFIFFGFVGAFMCQCGDIFASLLKRRARVKDYGTVFPGHGGIMDRMDGLIFVASFALIFLFIVA